MVERIKDMIKMELWLEKDYYDDLMWLCKKINDPLGTAPELVAETLLQVAIENTVNDPEQVQSWIEAFED